jgi:hypothetical protein
VTFGDQISKSTMSPLLKKAMKPGNYSHDVGIDIHHIHDGWMTMTHQINPKKNLAVAL